MYPVYPVYPTNPVSPTYENVNCWIPVGPVEAVIWIPVPDIKLTVSKPTAVNSKTPSTSQYLNVLFIATIDVPVELLVTSKPESISNNSVFIFE